MLIRKLSMLSLLIIIVMGFSVTTAQEQQTVFRFATLQGSFIDNVNTLLVEQFNELHPDIEVQVEYLPNGDISIPLTAQAAAGTLPDVTFIADLFVVPFAQAGISIDMQPYAEADPDFELSDVYENMLALSEVEGEGLYMIPSSYDVVTMYYNKTMFEEAGAPLPTAESTWQDVIDSCVMIRENLGNYCITANGTGIGDQAKWWAQYVPWIVGYGGQIISDDGTTVMLSSPETLAGLQAYTDMWTVSDIGQPFDFDAGGNCFLVGQCAIYLHIPAIMQAVRALDPQPFEWDVEQIPTLPEGKFTGMGTYGFTITADAQDPQLAWDFIKGLLSPEMQTEITLQYSGMPLLRSLRENPEIVALEGPPDNIDAFIANGANGITPPYFPGDCGSLYAGRINQEINDAFDAVIIGGSSVEEAFTIANDNIQGCLDG
ncbi:MAG: extracellular solute-binding protein [Burkholderiales bacterium]|nr:extracellular solute-binding protein [Anaerolineae bacterium]